MLSLEIAPPPKSQIQTSFSLALKPVTAASCARVLTTSTLLPLVTSTPSHFLLICGWFLLYELPNIQVGLWGPSCQSLLQALQAHTAFFCCTCLANMNLNDLNFTHSLSLHQGARHCWRKVTQTDKLLPPSTQDAPVCWQSCCASLIHLLSYSLKKLSKYFLSPSTSNMSHLSLIDFHSYFRKTQKYQKRPAWFHATKFTPPSSSALVFLSSWYNGVSIPSFKMAYFSSCSEPEDTGKWFLVAAIWRSLVTLTKAILKWDGKKLEGEESNRKAIDNSFDKSDYEGRQLLLSFKPWTINYCFHLSPFPLSPLSLPFNIQNNLCHLNNSSNS